MADDEEQDEDGSFAAAVAKQGDDDEDGEDKPKGSKKLLFVIIGVVVVLLGAGGALYFMGIFDSKPAGEEEVAEVAEKKEATKEEEDPKGTGVFLEIPTMIVNLNTPDGSPRFLRLSVQLELEDASDGPEIEAVMPRVVDQFQTYLRELRPADLQGSEGIYRLQMEMLWRVNRAAEPIKIRDVLFQEILIQ